MRAKKIFSTLIALSLAVAFSGVSLGQSVPPPPKTVVKNITESIHGVEIIDPYRWLEDQNSSETRAWIDAQNTYSHGILSKVPSRDELERQFSALIKVDAMTSPALRNGRYFFTKRAADQDQSMIYMRRGMEGKDQLLVDPSSFAADHSASVNLGNVSHDASLLVYNVRLGGADEVVPHILNVETGKDLPESFPRARYSGLSFLPDKSGLYYSRVTKEGPRVYFHKLGTPVESDAEIFGKGIGPEKGINVAVNETGHYLVIGINYGSSSNHSEIYLQDLAGKGPIVPVVNDVAAGFVPAMAGDRMFLRTNWNALHGRVLEVDLKSPSDRSKWREVIPQGEAVIEGMSLAGGMIALQVAQNITTRIRLYDPSGKLVREITPPTLGNMSGLNGRWENNEAFFTFSSFHVPATIYRYGVASGKQSVWFQSKVPVQADQYEVKQVWYTSKDGTKIPMFVAHAKGIKLDGNNPTLLTGYGGFNLPQTPGFSPAAATWMARGGVYALANLRGGGEFGEEWHHAGMFEKKQNVFDDFIGAAEWLIKNNYTKPSRLAVMGGSNGGLLVGAMLTQRPDLFGAVLCRFPLLDMVRYDKFLVGSYWVTEYGSADNAEQFKYIYAYSPYQHVKQGTKYPAVLFVTGDSDTRVAPLHARKMTAMVQSSTGSDKPVMLLYDTLAGHSQGASTSKQVGQLVDEFSFLLWQLGAVQESAKK
ncbi:MAG TPA: prolyl oligopeptidase family serine peptidase [Candidatus Angelobacter sp.]